MADVAKLLDDSAMALIAGDSEGALRLLSQVEKVVLLKPQELEEGVQTGLHRLMELAQAARDGVADARALIQKAGGNARNLQTYDVQGHPQAVSATRGALGRF